MQMAEGVKFLKNAWMHVLKYRSYYLFQIMLTTLDLSNLNRKISITFAVDVDSVSPVDEYECMLITWPFLQCHYNKK